MRAALERGGVRPRSLAAREGSSRVAPIALLGGAASVVTAAVFAGGGSSDASIPWIGAGALVVAAGGVAAALVGVLPWPSPSRLGALSIALFALFVLWNGLTVVWSIAPDRSWDYFNRGLVYLAFLVIGLFVGAVVRRAPLVVAQGLTILVSAALLWALAGKVFPALYSDGGRIARLRAPVEYWNALALLFALGLPLALWIATDERRGPRARAGAAVLVYALIVGLLLTYSRAGILAAALSTVVWLVLSSARTATVATLLAAGPVALAVGLWAFRQPGIAADMQDYSTRKADGAEFGLALVVGGAAVWLAAGLTARLAGHWRGRRWPGRPAAAAAVVLVALAAAALALKAGDVRAWASAQADEFTNPPTELLEQSPSRLTSFSSNNRWDWWQEAWSAFRSKPFQGTGAGSFATTHRLLRDNPLSVAEPHNEALQFLGETGLVGALLAGGAALFGLLAVAEALRRLRGAERAAAVGLAAGLAAYFAHSFVDWDWDFVAVNAPVFAVFGAFFTAGRSGRRRRTQPAWVLVPLLVLLAAVYSLAAPWLAERRVESAFAALSEGKPPEALDAADQARSLNPLSVEPLVAISLAYTALDRLGDARGALVEAVELQPLNPDAWYELGLFELEVAGRPRPALRYLERSHELDRFGPAGDLLPEARAAAGGN